jgi:hypothetical protein
MSLYGLASPGGVAVLASLPTARRLSHVAMA